MNFKPNVELEQKIICELMNRPSDVRTIKIDDDWFNVTNLRYVLDAIKDNPGATDYLDWFTTAKKRGYTDNYTTFEKLSDSFVTDGNLNKQVATLHLKHINDLINGTLLTCQSNPSNENQQKAVDLLREKRQLGINKVDGSIDASVDDMEKSLTEPRDKGIQVSGFNHFNQFLGGGLYSGLFTVSAKTGIGKTTYVMNMIDRLINYQPDVEINLFSLEMSKPELLQKLVSTETGIDSNSLRDPYHDIASDKLKEFVRQTLEKIKASRLKIYDKTTDLSDIISAMETNRAPLQKNKYVAFIDYVGLINVDNMDSGAQRYLQLGQITRELKSFSNEYDAPVIVLSQMNRGSENRQDKTPKLSDIRESSNVAMDSNAVIALSPNDDDNDLIDVTFLKNRSGDVGQYQMEFVRQKSRMFEVDNHENQ